MGHATTPEVLESKVASTTRPLIYQPLNYINCEPRDLISLKNLESWAEELCHHYEKDIECLSTADLAQSMVLDTMSNNYTFILASQGQFAQSEKVLRDIIQFWGDKFAKTNDVLLLTKCVQSTINLARLFRMQQNYEQFWSAFEQYQCLDEKQEIELAGHKISKERLSEVDDALVFLQRVSMWEYLKTSLIQQRFDDVLALETILPTEQIKTRVFREAQIIALLYTGDYERAKQLIRGVMHNTHGTVQNMFYYRYYELLQCQGKTEQAQSVLADICALVAHTQLHNLEERMFAAKLVSESNANFSSDIAQHALAQFKQVKDEFNYAKLLLQLYQQQPDEQIKQQLVSIGHATGYGYLRYLINKVVELNEVNVNHHWSDKLGDCFSQILKR